MTVSNLTDLARLTDLATGLTQGLKFRRITLNAQRVEYLEAGEGDPVIFIHGFSGINYQWRYWLHRFKSDYRVIAVTIPDLSPTLEFTRSHYSFRNYAEWLEGFIAAMGVESCHLISHCTGSCITAFYASLSPGRVKSLTMLGPPDFRETNKELGIINTFDRADLLEGFDAEKCRYLIDQLLYSPPRIPSLILTRLAARITKNSNSIGFLLSELSRSSNILRQRLPLIESPTLILAGQQDTYFSHPDACRFYEQQIPNSRRLELERCGHFPLNERAEDCIARVGAFLEELA